MRNDQGDEMQQTFQSAGGLQGKRIAITRAGEQASSLIEKLRALGAEPIVCSTISIVPPESYEAVDAALLNITQYDWIIFTSVNGVTAFMDRYLAFGVPIKLLSHVRIGVVGPTTAEVLGKYGVTPVVVPKSFVAHALIDALGTQVMGKKVLLPRANIAKNDLPTALRKNGALVDEIVVYRTEPGEGITDLLAQVQAETLDAITFASSSAVRYFIDGAIMVDHAIPIAERPTLPPWLEQLWARRRPAIFCIGPVTAETAQALGVPVDGVAERYDADGLIAAIVNWFTTRPLPSRN